MKRGTKARILVLAMLALGTFSQVWTSSALAQLPSGDEFTFVRIRWTDNRIRYGYNFVTQAPLWAHDYPQAEENLYTALKATSSVKISEETKVFTFADEEIFNYPFIYACEIGYLSLSDEEVTNLREYLLRGGFLIVDDFRLQFEWQNWRHEIRKVLPEFPLREIKTSHPIFHCFFDLNDGDLYKLTPYLPYPPRYFAITDENGRMLVLINFNTDVGDGWELPNETPDFSTRAFKLGINYLIYSYTH
ncbi:DUF4159 domain-containing protein [bacterium]|nr:DUF4159 domain-containing protein [bacterium]